MDISITITQNNNAQQLTLIRGVSGVGLAWFTGLFTEPFLTTLAWDFYSLRRLTPDPGWLVLGAK